MKYGLTLAGVPLLEKAEVARKAQDAGFDSIWNDDNPGAEGTVALTTMVNAAPRIRVGSGILRAFLRHPVTMASAFSNMAMLSEAGVIMGLGTGTKRQNLFQYGIEVPRPVARLRSVVGMMREFWVSAEQGQAFHWEDPYYTVRSVRAANAGVRSLAVKPVPIWLAAVNHNMLRLAGEVADGLAGHPVFSVEYIQEVVRPLVDEGRRKSRYDSPFELATWAITAVDENRERARSRAAQQIAFYLSTKAYSGVLDFYGCGHLSEPLREAILDRGDAEAGAALFPQEVIDRIAVTGTVEEIREQVRRYEGVVDQVVFAVAGRGATPGARKQDIDQLMELGKLSS